MKMRVKYFDIASYFFFLLYFTSYIGEKTAIKYAGIVIFQIYLLIHIKKSDVFNRDRGFLVILNGIFILLMISLLINFNPSGAIKTLSLVDLFIFTFFMFSRSITGFRVDEKHLITIITNSLLIALLGAFVFHYNDTILSYGRSSSVTYRHIFGLGEPSIVGFLCFVEFVLTFYLFTCRKKKRMTNGFLYLKMLLPLYMVYLADIRASIVAIVFFVGFYFFSKMPKNKATLAIKVLGLPIFMFLSIVYLSFSSVDTNKLNYLLSNRLYYYQLALMDIMQKHALLFGVGSFRNSEVLDLNRIQIDNAFLDVLYQYGVISMILFLILLIKIGLELHKISRGWSGQSQQANAYKLFINSYFVSVILYSMVEKNLFSISSALSLVTFLLLFWYIEKYKPLRNNLVQQIK